MKKFMAGVFAGILIIAIVQSPPLKPIRDQIGASIVEFTDTVVDSYVAEREKQEGEK